ncbi:hypothetical protein PGB34_03220 [Xenophilus arseniciresistens]|uniref:Lipoprotein n=1 Tax=Xenophilus arseniciresistens TaxID=1283306 RepID=A0AAE3N401_9BURK|nr:hypothetical protein [Xenophilus arseniciresistens]MDA7415365.1 hypothetical protein [Xenophilus arseniciresistens]
MHKRLSAIAAAAAAALAMTACGGGGGGGGFLPILPPPAPAPAPAPGPAPAPSPAPAPAPEPPPAPITRTFLYEALPTAADSAAFLAQLNSQGARGFRFLSGFAFTTSPTTTEVVEGYVKDADTTYSYELLALPADRAAMQAQLDAQGARGFTWGGAYVAGKDFVYIYRKDNGSTASYSYRVLLAESGNGAFLTQANAQGAEGYFNTTTAFVVGTETVSVYEKASTGGATYGYELLDPTGDAAGFYAQLNAQGARGYRFRTEFLFSDAHKVVFAKDLSQASTFAFYGLPPESTSAAFIAQANAEGAKGNGLIGDYVLPGNANSTLYFTPKDCSGLLCVPVGLFGL